MAVLSREKGLDTLIESAIISKYTLLVVGVGPLYEKYKDLNYEHIKFLGFKMGKTFGRLYVMLLLL